MSDQTPSPSQEKKLLLNQELDNLRASLQTNLKDVKRYAIGEAWKILQLVTAQVIQEVEKRGKDLAGQDKKELVMNFISNFYDSVFLVIDIPVLPNFIESILHSYVKKILMILVGASIDALVTTFRNAGVFSNN